MRAISLDGVPIPEKRTRKVEDELTDVRRMRLALARKLRAARRRERELRAQQPVVTTTWLGPTTVNTQVGGYWHPTTTNAIDFSNVTVTVSGAMAQSSVVVGYISPM